MLGAIFGDIVGSVYEFHNVKSMEFPLLSRNSQPTDDSIMTIAVATGMRGTGPTNLPRQKRLARVHWRWYTETERK